MKKNTLSHVIIILGALCPNLFSASYIPLDWSNYSNWSGRPLASDGTITVNFGNVGTYENLIATISVQGNSGPAADGSRSDAMYFRPDGLMPDPPVPEFPATEPSFNETGNPARLLATTDGDSHMGTYRLAFAISFNQPIEFIFQDQGVYGPEYYSYNVYGDSNPTWTPYQGDPTHWEDLGISSLDTDINGTDFGTNSLEFNGEGAGLHITSPEGFLSGGPLAETSAPTEILSIFYHATDDEPFQDLSHSWTLYVAIPEPSSLLLSFSGLTTLLLRRRRL